MDNENQPGVSIEREMKKSYLDYAMSVIIGRALPDVRDGLKPVHRRVLFAMRELKNDWNKPYKKSARVVGDVIGKYHPHGDTAVYDTIVRLAQDFSMRYPLVNGQGNFGSIDGDPPAAMRYTEVRMMRLAHHMMDDLDKETVDFFPNYDETLLEPGVLPARIPSLLINGSAGIAVGMATNIPPHNLREVIDSVVALVDNPDMTVEDLLAIIPGPDFPTGGIIYGLQGIREAYETGRGIVRVRARMIVETNKQDNSETIVVTELPYQVNKARLVEKIAELVRHKIIEGIRFVRDESDKDGLRVAIGLKKDQFADVIINQLYKHTRMESSFGIIFLAIVDNRPELLNLKGVLQHFIAHRKEIVVRRTRYDLKKAEEKAHILEGYKIALDNLDAVVAMIRQSASPAEAKERLMTAFALSAIQAQAILDLRLQRLTGMERDKIIEDYRNTLKDIAYFKEVLSSERMVLDIIKQELMEIRETYGDERRSEIVAASREITLEDMIVEEDMVVTVSQRGYIKRTPLSLYQSQQRGGKGKTAMATRTEDFVRHLFVASTHHTLLFFTNLGKVYWRKVYEIPQASRTGAGKAIVNLMQFEQDERLTTVLAVPQFEPGHFILMATKNGIIKKTDVMAYSRPRTVGIIALNLMPGDELISTRITDGTLNVFLGTANGQSIRFHETDVRPAGRVARGVRGINLGPGDQVVGMEVLTYGQTLISVTENGYGKRTAIDEYPVQKRGGKGVITIKTNARNGRVVNILLADDADDLMLVTNTGKLIRMAIEGISVIGRNTQGVKLIEIAPQEHVIGAARLAESAAEAETEDFEEK